MTPREDGGLNVFGVIKGPGTISTMTHATMEAQFGVAAADQMKRDSLTEPGDDASPNEWFAYYDRCKSVRKKITHKDIAKKIGLSESRTKHRYREYKREIALK
jgi:hypothetical protein